MGQALRRLHAYGPSACMQARPTYPALAAAAAQATLRRAAALLAATLLAAALLAAAATTAASVVPPASAPPAEVVMSQAAEPAEGLNVHAPLVLQPGAPVLALLRGGPGRREVRPW